MESKVIYNRVHIFFVRCHVDQFPFHISLLKFTTYGLLTRVESGWLDISKVLFCVLMDETELSFANTQRKERRLYPVTSVDQISLVDKKIYYMEREHIFSGGTQMMIPDSQSQRTIQFILASRGASPIINCKSSFTAGESRIHAALLINIITTLFCHLDRCWSLGTLTHLC